MQLQDPPSFGARTEAQMATWGCGFRLPGGTDRGWMRFASTTAVGDIWIAAGGDQGPWVVAFSHPGVVAELASNRVADLPAPPGALSAIVAPDAAGLHAAVRRAYQLGVSLPDAPLKAFETKIRGLPTTTEAERLIVQRVGQDIFRSALIDYWRGRCPMTGIQDLDLLRASHIVAWAECESDELRLDVHNGLLLSSLWDAAFDKGRISFADDGAVLSAPNFDPAARAALGANTAPRLAPLTFLHRHNLARHRKRYGFDK